MQDRLLDNFHYQTLSPGVSPKKPLARHGRCDVYCGARETVGESSVSSGCWGEDSNHEYGWARRTPTYVAPIRFSNEPLCSAPQDLRELRIVFYVLESALFCFANQPSLRKIALQRCSTWRFP